MGKGSPFVSLRVPTAVLAQIDVALRELGERTRGEPPTRSGWILKAIQDALAKRERSRTWRKRSVAKEGNQVDASESI